MFYRFIITIFLFLTVSACQVEKRPIRYGEDECFYCKMLITDNRYGSELVSAKGKVYTFDSAECLVAEVLSNKSNIEIESTWVTNFNKPGQLIAAETAFYLISPDLKSPMSLNLTALNSNSDALELAKRFPGQIINWERAKELVIEKWLDK